MMRASRWWLAVVVVALALFAGCDGGFWLTSIDGFWDLGDVQFRYGDGRTWTLEDGLIEVDTTEGLIYLSGYDSGNELWAWRGEYDRSGNRVVAEDMPEMDAGDRDVMDLNVEFDRNRVDGAVTNWVYDGSGDLSAVGTAAVSGRRTSNPSAARDIDSAGAQPRAPKAVSG